MSKEKVTLWELIRTFRPIVITAVTLFIWVIIIQTVSKEDFNSLSTRVSILEEQMPDKEMMLTLQENQARMHAQLEAITKNLDSVTKNLDSVIEKIIMGIAIK